MWVCDKCKSTNADMATECHNCGFRYGSSHSPAGYVHLSIADLRTQLEAAHMAGQSDAGVDPGYSNARAYTDQALKQFDA